MVEQLARLAAETGNFQPAATGIQALVKKDQPADAAGINEADIGHIKRDILVGGGEFLEQHAHRCHGAGIEIVLNS